MDIEQFLAKLRSNKFIQNNKTISEILTLEGIKQFQRYIITGVTTFIAEYLLFYLFYEIVFKSFAPGFKLANSLFAVDRYTYRYLISNSLGYSIDFCLNFTMNRVYSFKSKAPLLDQVKKYGVLFVVNLIVTNILLYLLSDIMGITPYISKLLAMCVIVSWNFIVYKKFIYK